MPSSISINGSIAESISPSTPISLVLEHSTILSVVLIRIDPRSAKSIYTQIVDSVVSDIESGSLEPGARLPSARGLAESLKVNMHTVLRAYSVLQDQGHVEMRRGRGGVRVSEKTGMQLAVSNVVALAKRERVGLEKIHKLISEEWQ